MRPILFCIAFLAVVGWIVSQSQTFQSCMQPYQQLRGTQNTQQSVSQVQIAARPYQICLGNFIHDEAEGIIAAFTIIVAIATIFLWSATRDLVRSAEGVAQKQLGRSEDVERAYLSAGGSRQSPRPLTSEEIILAGLPPAPRDTIYTTQSEWFQFDVNNHGKTPGEILEYGYGWCEVDEINNLAEFPDYRWVKFRYQIGPGTQSHGIKRIKIPPDKPVIYGRIGYKDIFGKCHSHGFIQEIGKPIAPPHPSYIETDPSWDLPHVGRRNYQEEEPQS